MAGDPPEPNNNLAGLDISKLKNIEGSLVPKEILNLLEEEASRSDIKNIKTTFAARISKARSHIPDNSTLAADANTLKEIFQETYLSPLVAIPDDDDHIFGFSSQALLEYLQRGGDRIALDEGKLYTLVEFVEEWHGRGALEEGKNLRQDRYEELIRVLTPFIIKKMEQVETNSINSDTAKKYRRLREVLYKKGFTPTTRETNATLMAQLEEIAGRFKKDESDDQEPNKEVLEELTKLLQDNVADVEEGDNLRELLLDCQRAIEPSSGSAEARAKPADEVAAEAPVSRKNIAHPQYDNAIRFLRQEMQHQGIKPDVVSPEELYDLVQRRSAVDFRDESQIEFQKKLKADLKGIRGRTGVRTAVAHGSVSGNVTGAPLGMDQLENWAKTIRSMMGVRERGHLPMPPHS